MPKEKAQLQRYLDEAYKVAQLLKQSKELDAAVKAYQRILNMNKNPELERPLNAELAQLYVELANQRTGADKQDYLKKAWNITEELQWKGIDVWFGSSLVTLAFAEKARGNVEKAEEVLREHKDLLKQIDQSLELQGLAQSRSPLAGARYLEAQIYEEQGLALLKNPKEEKEAIAKLSKALSSYYAVFGKYGQSDWGAKAGIHANRLKELLEGRGKKVRVNMSRLQSKVGAQQFRLADSLMKQEKFAQAIDEYLLILNQFPEVGEAPRALKNVALAYAYLGDDKAVRMLCEYLGERLHTRDASAQALLILGKHYVDSAQIPMQKIIYEVYLRYFPGHNKATDILLYLSDVARKEGHWQQQINYLNRIITDYPSDRNKLKALQILAWRNYKKKEYPAAIRSFKLLINEVDPGYKKVRAQFAMGACFQMLSDYQQALRSYGAIIKWLNPKIKVNPYHINSEIKTKNELLLEKTTYQLAHCLTRLREPASEVTQYQKKGVIAYTHFLSTYPKSPYAPKAMIALGKLQLVLGNHNKAAEIFQALARDYPDSEEGKNALYSIISAFVEVDQMDLAQQSFQKMLEEASVYSPAEFLKVGELMMSHEYYDEAVKAFEQVEHKTQERKFIEHAWFGLGNANFELKAYPKAIEFLQRLMEHFPLSGLYYEARFIIAKAYQESGKLEEAIQALTEVFKLAENAVLINQASYDLGLVQKKQGEMEAALASFQRVALLADPKDSELRLIIEGCILESLEISLKLLRYKDVLDSCDQYLNLYPDSEKVPYVKRIKGEAKLKALNSI